MIVFHKSIIYTSKHSTCPPFLTSLIILEKAPEIKNPILPLRLLPLRLHLRHGSSLDSSRNNDLPLSLPQLE